MLFERRCRLTEDARGGPRVNTNYTQHPAFDSLKSRKDSGSFSRRRASGHQWTRAPPLLISLSESEASSTWTLSCRPLDGRAEDSSPAHIVYHQSRAPHTFSPPLFSPPSLTLFPSCPSIWIGCLVWQQPSVAPSTLEEENTHGCCCWAASAACIVLH